jgi:hypothetical protein
MSDLAQVGFAARGYLAGPVPGPVLQSRVAFQLDDWSGGAYHPTMAGLRPGGMIAAAWAVFQHYGEAGFLTRTAHARHPPAPRDRGDCHFHVPAIRPCTWGFASTIDVSGGRRHGGAPLVRAGSSRPRRACSAHPDPCAGVDDPGDLREVADAIGRSGRTGEKRSNYAT